MAEDCTLVTYAEAASSLSEAFLLRDGRKWLKNDQVPLHLECAQAPNENMRKKSFLPFKRQKRLKREKYDFTRRKRSL